MKRDLRVTRPVTEALSAGRPVLALESTVIAHGLPYPRNAEVAHRLESIARDEGAQPATIGVVDGRPVVGLDEEAIDVFSRGDDVRKASVRDLGPIIASSRSAATTVAATALLARRAGIEVFATGGIGGVHRGGERSLDISADLVSLSRTPIAVVCAGAKAVLDLPRTMEVLETLGVPVIGLRVDEFPAFYSTGSGLELEHSMQSEAEAARVVDEHWALGLDTAVLVCNPPPADAALDPVAVAGWIDAALSDADAAGVTGKRLTPWLLAALADASEGATVETNIALLESNVRAAARLAVAMRRGRSTRIGGF